MGGFYLTTIKNNIDMIIKYIGVAVLFAVSLYELYLIAKLSRSLGDEKKRAAELSERLSARDVNTKHKDKSK